MGETMPIDFSTYKPGTVLRVECRDGKFGYVHPNRDTSAKPNLLIRDDGWNDWLAADGRRFNDGIHDLDVIRIVARMVEAPL